MTAVPGKIRMIQEWQDNRGFRSLTEITGFLTDVSASGDILSDIYAWNTAMTTAMAALSNAKLVRQGFTAEWSFAQEPSSETGTYQLVTQKAHLQGGDGNGAFMSVSIPAPKDALFLTTSQDNLIVVNPAAGILTTWQAALSATSGTFGLGTAAGGHPFSQFFGGELRAVKPRRRRVLQGA